MPDVINESHLSKFYDLLNHKPYGVTEVRIIIGYFDNKDKFVRSCISENGNGDIYAVLNPCPTRFLVRAMNRFRKLNAAVKSDDIEHLTTLMIHIKPADGALDISPNTKEIVSYLESEGLCQQSVIIRSGNSYQLLLPMESIEITDNNRSGVIAKSRKFVYELQDRFRHSQITIASTYDLPRTIRIPGTIGSESNTCTPVTELVRTESTKLKHHILERDGSELIVEYDIIKQSELPTELDLAKPCWMCGPANRLWVGDNVSNRSDAIFSMMRMLSANGLTREYVIAYTQSYDMKIGDKYTSRNSNGLRELCRLYAKITKGGEKASKPCSWMTTNGYCTEEDSLLCKRKPMPRYRRVEFDEEIRDIISLKEARRRLNRKIDSLSIGGEKPQTYLLVYPPGTGKTTKLGNHIVKKRYKTLWLCPTHKQAKETIDKHLRGAKPKAVILKSRMQMIEDKELKCPYEEIIIRLSKSDQKSISKLCELNCSRHNRGCEYDKRYSKARKARIVVGMHSHLQVLNLAQYPTGIELVVIDESFSNHYKKKVSFTVEDVRRLIEFLNGFMHHNLEMQSFETDIQCLVKFLKDFIVLDGVRLSIEELPVLSDKFWEYYNYIMNNLVDAESIKDVLGMLRYIKKHKLDIVRVGNKYAYITTARIPDNVDIIIVDASGTKKFYEWMLAVKWRFTVRITTSNRRHILGSILMELIRRHLL